MQLLRKLEGVLLRVPLRCCNRVLQTTHQQQNGRFQTIGSLRGIRTGTDQVADTGECRQSWAGLDHSHTMAVQEGSSTHIC